MDDIDKKIHTALKVKTDDKLTLIKMIDLSHNLHQNGLQLKFVQALK